jgi:thiol-disulfide isomerase/thioredoxin
MNNTVKNLIIAFVLLNLVVFGVVLYFQRAERTSAQVPSGPAPTFMLPAVDSHEMVSLKDFRGKVVLLDFWATWCPPCRKQMPAVQNIHDDPALEADLKIVSVNSENGPNRRAKVEAYLKDNNYTFTTVLDDGSASGQYAVSRLPTLVVITPSGEVSHTQTGVHSEEDLRRLVAEAKEMGASSQKAGAKEQSGARGKPATAN